MFAIIFVICISLVQCLGSCRDKTDVQPPHKEIVLVQDHTPDTVLVVIADTSGKVIVMDSFVAVQNVPPTSPLLDDVQEFQSSIDVVYMPPLDSLVDAIYMSQVGVREATGHNDGKDVEKYLKSVQLTKGNAWCAAFVKWTFDQAGIKTTITGWSPTAHNKKNIVYMDGRMKQEIRRGDVFTIWFPRLKRIGHTGFVQKKFGFNSVMTVEGNTNSAGSREGDGVYVKTRPKSTLYSITRWF